jgi:hypothetical protein
MKEKIISLFKEKSNGQRIVFHPHIKCRTDSDFVFIYAMYSTKMINTGTSYFVKAEIGFEEAKPIGLHLLSEEVLKAIWLRLIGMAKPVTEKIR